MVFSSLVFLLAFLPCVLILYFLMPNIRLRNIVLCVFSLVFYAWGEPVYLFLMLLLILVNYALALLIQRCPQRGKLLLALALVADIGAIAFFKYINFILENRGLLLRAVWGYCSPT